MKILQVLIPFIFVICITGCCKKNDTVGPDDTNNLVAYCQYPQTDIDWPSLADSPWPMFLHDPQHTSRSPLAGPLNGTFTRIGPVNEEIFSSPAVTEDGLIIFGAEGVFAFDASGSQVWHFDTGGTHNDLVDSSPCIASDGTIYVGCNNGFLYALHSDGRLKWNYDTEKFIGLSSPSISKDGDVVYIQSFNAFENDTTTLFAIDTTGHVLWSFDMMQSFVNTSPTLSPDGNTVYVTNGSVLYALYGDGTVKWEFPVEDRSSIPVIDNAGNIYLIANGILYAVNPAGIERWHYSIRINFTAPCICSNGYLYTIGLTTKGIGMFAFDYTGVLMWQVELPGSDGGVSSPSIDVEGNIYIGLIRDVFEEKMYNFVSLDMDGNIRYCIDLQTPEGLTVDIDTSPVICSNGTIFTGSDNARGYYLFAIE